MYTVKAVYDGTNFTLKQPIALNGEYEVVITFIGPVNKEAEQSLHFLREPDLTKVPTIGEWDLMTSIPDNFDEPLEEMKEYMY